MALFAYKAIDPRGKTMLGQIEAINLVDLELRLKRMGLDLVRGGPTRHGGRLSSFGANKGDERLNFFLPIVQLIAAGGRPLELLIDLRRKLENSPFLALMCAGLQEYLNG